MRVKNYTRVIMPTGVAFLPRVMRGTSTLGRLAGVSNG